MKENFNRCFHLLLAHEGGFVNHPDDPGGATNWGVTKKTYEKYIGQTVTVERIRSLTPDDVEPIYRDKYFDAVSFDDLPSGIDWTVADWAVNSGPRRAAKALQRVVKAKPDGSIGPQTLASVAALDAAQVIRKMHHTRQKFYERLGTFPTFGRGWTRRNAETLTQSLELLGD